MKVYETKFSALFDSGAIQNLMKSKMTVKLSLIQERILAKTNPASEQKPSSRGALRDFSV